jgi:hypothetical protein
LYRKADESEIASAEHKVIAHSNEHIKPSRWLSVLGFRQKVYGYTNGSAVGYLRAGQLEMCGSERVWKEKIRFSAEKCDSRTVGYKL